MLDLARKFAITPAAVSDAVQREEKMPKCPRNKATSWKL